MSDAAQPYTTSSSGRKRANSASYSPEPQKKAKSFSIFDSQASSSAASSSSSVTPSLAVITSLSVSKLEALPKSELLKYIVILQGGLKTSKNEVSDMKKTAVDVEKKIEDAKSGTMSPELIHSKAAALAGLMNSEIRKQMKWCKFVYLFFEITRFRFIFLNAFIFSPLPLHDDTIDLMYRCWDHNTRPLKLHMLMHFFLQYLLAKLVDQSGLTVRWYLIQLSCTLSSIYR